MGKTKERWLETKANFKLWHDNISARMRRGVMTKWTGEAWWDLREVNQFEKCLT